MPPATWQQQLGHLLGEGLTAAEQAAESSAAMDEDKMRRAFNLFDKDGDGKISQQELGEVLKTLGKATSPAELKQMIGGSVEGMFTERGGCIDFATFTALMVRAARAPHARAQCAPRWPFSAPVF